MGGGYNETLLSPSASAPQVHPNPSRSRSPSPDPHPSPNPYPNPNQVIRYANVAKGDARYDLVISNLTEYTPNTNGVKYNGKPRARVKG